MDNSDFWVKFIGDLMRSLRSQGQQLCFSELSLEFYLPTKAALLPVALALLLLVVIG